jgi:hypothetical protein
MRRGSVASAKISRDELSWVVTHVYMKAMLGIFSCSYPQSTSKNVLSSLLGMCLFFNKISDKIRTEPAWN